MFVREILPRSSDTAPPTRGAAIRHQAGRCLSASTTSSRPSSALSCSQTLTTTHPSARSACVLCLSRSTVRCSFGPQYEPFTSGCLPWTGHECQKQPSTKTATRRLVKTMSGRTRHSARSRRRSHRNRYPSRWSLERSASSGIVSRRRIARMLRDRPSVGDCDPGTSLPPLTMSNATATATGKPSSWGRRYGAAETAPRTPPLMTSCAGAPGKTLRH